MTKKDYKIIAEALKQAKMDAEMQDKERGDSKMFMSMGIAGVIGYLEDALLSENPLFDSVKFRGAIGE